MERQSKILGRRSEIAEQAVWCGDRALRRLLGAIGRPEFFSDALSYLGEICDAQHLHVFMLETAKPRILSAMSRDGSGSAIDLAEYYLRNRLWDADGDMQEGCQVDADSPILVRVDGSRYGACNFREFYRQRHLRERLMLFRREAFGVLGVSMVRSADQGLLGPESGGQLDCAMNFIFPMVAKHMEVTSQSRRTIQALTSLNTIEATIALAAEALPPREMQVAARLLYGLNANSIAVDLDIGRETVLTHRKRLYERLAIGCHRELLLWYLELHAHNGLSVVTPLRFPD